MKHDTKGETKGNYTRLLRCADKTAELNQSRAGIQSWHHPLLLPDIQPPDFSLCPGRSCCDSLRFALAANGTLPEEVDGLNLQTEERKLAELPVEWTLSYSAHLDHLQLIFDEAAARRLHSVLRGHVAMCPLYRGQREHFGAQCAVHRVRNATCIWACFHAHTLHTASSTWPLHSPHCTMPSAQCTGHCALHTLHLAHPSLRTTAYSTCMTCTVHLP